MGIYNCEVTLAESIESVLNQSFTDYNMVLCDDGSTDNTYKIALEYKNKYPSKIILIKNQQNQGLNYTLNKCIENAEGEYLARMDGDDKIDPDRFKYQVDFLDSNKDYAFVSSAMIYFDENGEWGRSHPSIEPRKKDFIKGTPFSHAASMIRKTSMSNVNGYTVNKRLLRVEDYHLWIKMYALGLKGYNIQKPLYFMRDDNQAYRRRNLRNRVNEVYVKILAVKLLKLPVYYYLFVFKPILTYFIPKKIYMTIHKNKLKRIQKK